MFEGKFANSEESALCWQWNLYGVSTEFLSARCIWQKWIIYPNTMARGLQRRRAQCSCIDCIALVKVMDNGTSHYREFRWMFKKIWFKFSGRVSLKILVLCTPCFGSSYPQGVHVPPAKNHCVRLGGSISLKFVLETRLQSKSFDTLVDLLGFRVQKLWCKLVKIFD